MSTNKGLAVCALLIGIGGLAFGAYSVFILPNTILEEYSGNIQITNIWTVELESPHTLTGTFTDVPDMDKSIEVEKGETVYITFDGQFKTDSTTGTLFGGVRIMLDGVEINGSRREFTVDIGTASFLVYALSTGVIIDDLDDGDYEIQLQAYGIAGGPTERLDDGLMVITTYK